MAKTPNQKLKILYIMDYLTQNTDAEHPASMRDILDYLEKNGISAERKSVYDDMEALRVYGLDVETAGEGRSTGYYVASRTFQLAELKLLVDSVQSSKFITQRKTDELIKKIEKLASGYEAQLLQRQVFVANRIKTMNESIYYNIDEIHAGISGNRKIKFKYLEYTIAKERVFRHGGSFYEVSPYALIWDDENYYLLAYDSAAGIIKHYRVDKMKSISLCRAAREGAEVFSQLDMGAYTRKVFGMFSGREEKVTMRFSNRLINPVLDRLGQDVLVIPDGSEHFTVSADVVVSPVFFAWVAGFGADAKILRPEVVADEMRRHIMSVAAQYE